MKLFVAVAVLMAVALAAPIDYEAAQKILGKGTDPEAATVGKTLIMDQDLVDHINALDTTWKASTNAYFAGWSVDEVKRSNGVQKATQFPPQIDYSDVKTELPTNFRSKDKWPGCIGPILNQAKCGSCWAFGATEAISDRMCIKQQKAGNNGTYLQLGPLDLTTCGGQGGCEGGELYGAWLYAQYNGLATEKCLPYNEPLGPIQPCAGNPHNPLDNPCTDFQQTPPCTQQCSQKTDPGQSYESTKHKISSVYGVSGEQNMMQEIFQNGPIESAFTVYADFVHYTSGVYQHVTGNALGGHAIKIIGWGEENGTPFWWVQNSWTTEWADLGGYFKILRGQDECGIESQGMAGTV